MNPLLRQTLSQEVGVDVSKESLFTIDLSKETAQSAFRVTKKIKTKKKTILIFCANIKTPFR